MLIVTTLLAMANSAAYAQNVLGRNELQTQKAVSALSSGTLALDGGEIGVVEHISSQSRGLAVAMNNVDQARGLFETADSAYASLTQSYQRVRELAVQYKNGTLSNSDKSNIAREAQSLLDGMNSIAVGTSYNGNPILSTVPAQVSTTVSLQIGPNASDTLDLSMNQMSVGFFSPNPVYNYLNTATTTGGFPSNFSAITDRSDGLNILDDGLTRLSKSRAQLGANLSRLDSVQGQLEQSMTDLQAAQGRIQDTDYAKETLTYTKSQIIAQSATGMLKNISENSRTLLQLIQG